MSVPQHGNPKHVWIKKSISVNRFPEKHQLYWAEEECQILVLEKTPEKLWFLNIGVSLTRDHDVKMNSAEHCWTLLTQDLIQELKGQQQSYKKLRFSLSWKMRRYTAFISSGIVKRKKDIIVSLQQKM